MPNLYASPARVKARISLDDTLDDANILAALEQVSRDIDRFCGRRFYVEQRTRYFNARRSGCLRVDDLLAVTEIATDLSGTRDWPLTLLASDFELCPPNALYESPPEPYTTIELAPLSGAFFVTGDPRGNRVTGKWGYYEVLELAGALLAEGLDASETAVDVANGLAYDVGQTLLIDSEQLYVSAIESDTLTVTRGVNGTTAASHLTASPIQRYTYPVVGEAAAQQAILAFRAASAVFGEIGGNEAFTQSWRQSMQMGLHPFVQASLATFRRMEQG